jgi:myosin-5
VNDAEAFEETTMALSLLGFSQREQTDMFKILAAILHLGNVTIMEAITEGIGGGADSEGSAIPVSSSGC